MRKLTERQREVLTFISGYIEDRSYPPSTRDIAEHFGVTMKGAHDHVITLRRKNYLEQNGRCPRTLKLMASADGENASPVVMIPIVGTVAAGIPILSEENHEGMLRLESSMLKRNITYFAVRVRGDSMSGVGIMDGDMAVIEKRDIVANGEIAVAVIDDAVTLKRFRLENSRIGLYPENPKYQPIYCQCEETRILGKLFRIIRDY